MKFFKNIFKKKKDENNLNNNELSKNVPLEYEENTNPKDYDFEPIILESSNNTFLNIPSKEEIEKFFIIDKHLNYLEKIPLIIETYHLGFEPPVELKSVSGRIGEIYKEKHGKSEFKFIYSNNIKIFLETANYNIGEVVEAIFLMGSSSFISASPFDRDIMFELALEIVGEDTTITIFRDDFEFQRVEFTTDDIKRYLSTQ